MLWYEFDFDGKFLHVKLLIKEKCPHTIITERYRFCCFKEDAIRFKSSYIYLIQLRNGLNVDFKDNS